MERYEDNVTMHDTDDGVIVELSQQKDKDQWPQLNIKKCQQFREQDSQATEPYVQEHSNEVFARVTQDMANFYLGPKERAKDTNRTCPPHDSDSMDVGDHLTEPRRRKWASKPDNLSMDEWMRMIDRRIVEMGGKSNDFAELSDIFGWRIVEMERTANWRYRWLPPKKPELSLSEHRD